jgi:ornithine cyclodeaminase/alanine dehydrogenase-like protein (mu-crystallin family)
VKNLPYIEADAISESLSYPDLIDSLKQAFIQPYIVPDRLHYELAESMGVDTRLLVMVAWGAEHYLGVKMVTLCSDNAAKGLPTLSGVYCLFDGKTGLPLAMLDGAELTACRTAAASVLAANCLIDWVPDTVLIMGAGKLCTYYIKAYTEIMKPARVLLWNRDIGKAEAVVESLNLDGTALDVTTNLEEAVNQADIISTITSSTEPLFPGKWCKLGCHLDLVGGYRPDMREVDDDLIRRAMIYVDTYQGAFDEAGDIIDPLNRGIISKQDIHADLAELVRGKEIQQEDGKDLTVFKSVGTAIEDLAAAVLVYERNIN